MPLRLNRYLAQCGIASRRAAEALILAGRISVNGVPQLSLACQIDPDRDRVQVDGVEVRPAEKKIYLALNKPPGIDVSRSDRHAPLLLFDILPREIASIPGLQAVGRLDRPTTGLILLTNDGELANRLTHPRHAVEKEYLCFGPAAPTPDQLRRLRAGVDLDDGPAQAILAQAIPPARAGQPHALRLVLCQGRKRVVRRMCAAVGFDLDRLHRVRVGPISLGDLPEGKCRELSPEEARSLQSGA